MSSVLPAPATTGFAPREGLRGAFAGFRRRHLILILSLSLGIPAMYALFALAFSEPTHPWPVLGGVGKYLVICFMTVYFAIVADNVLRHRAGPVWSLAIAFVAASVLSAALIQLITYGVIMPMGWDTPYKMETKGITLTQHSLLELVNSARWALITVVLYELLESNRRAGEELHAARMTALAAQQNLVEGELRAMQARVDPELLFNSLVAIDEGYAQGVEAGQQRLDGLIRFLRAALPSDFAETATVAREQELVEAYVALRNQRSADAVQLQVRVDPGTGGEQMPSMLLLPLIRWALAEPSVRSLRVRIGRLGQMLAIEVESDALMDATAPAEEIASVRERIAQLYADGAQLVIEHGRARLEIPRHAPRAQGA